MRVRFSAPARADLDSIAVYIWSHYPAIAPQVEARIRRVIAHIAEWPESAPLVAQRTGIRMMPVGRYPCRIYYRVVEGTVEIARVRHTAQRRLGK